MEEVWKSSRLSSLHHHPTTAAAHHDFFARPSSKDPPTRVDSRETFSAGWGGATALSLSSGSEFRCLENSDRTRSEPQLRSHANGGTLSFISSLNSPFEALASSTAVFSSFSKNMASENHNNSSDRHHKRMMKNRESAVRSRARKQAYTNQLENEVARLMEENAKLRRQLQKFCSASPTQLPKMQTLHRTLTAPF